MLYISTGFGLKLRYFDIKNRTLTEPFFSINNRNPNPNSFLIFFKKPEPITEPFLQRFGSPIYTPSQCLTGLLRLGEPKFKLINKKKKFLLSKAL